MVRYHNSGTQRFDDLESDSVNTEQVFSNSIPVTYTFYEQGGTYYADAERSGLSSFDGSDIETVLQSAIDAIGTASHAKGKILVKAGDYTLPGETSFDIPNNIVIEGEGKFATQFYLDGDTSTVFNATGTFNIQFRRFRLQTTGSTRYAANGFDMTDVNFVVFEEVQMLDLDGYGILAEGTRDMFARDLSVTSCGETGNGKAGFRIAGNSNYPARGYFLEKFSLGLGEDEDITLMEIDGTTAQAYDIQISKFTTEVDLKDPGRVLDVYGDVTGLKFNQGRVYGNVDNSGTFLRIQNGDVHFISVSFYTGSDGSPNAGKYFVEQTGGETTFVDCDFQIARSGYMGNSPVYAEGGDITLVGCRADGRAGSFTAYDLRVDEAEVIGCRSRNCENGGVALTNADGARVLGGVYKNNNQSDGGYGGVDMYGSTNCRIIGVRSHDDQGTKTQDFGVSERGGGAADNRIAHCDFRGNASAAVTLSADSTSVRDTEGYVSKNKGVATISSGTTTVSVSHGLDETPDLSDIQVTPVEALGSATYFYADPATIDSSSFTIAVDADPTQDVDFAWKAKIYA